METWVSCLGFLGKENNGACEGNGTCLAFWSKSFQIGQCMETSQDQCMPTQPSLHDYILMHVHPNFTHLVSIKIGKIKEHLPCWKYFDMKPLANLKTAMNLLANFWLETLRKNSKC